MLVVLASSALEKVSGVPTPVMSTQSNAGPPGSSLSRQV
jgi:hypothetical protein